MSLTLITGGDGFIGSHLAETLLRRGARVRVLDNLSARGGENVARLQALGGNSLELIRDDVRDPVACKAAASGAEFVLHEAGLGSVARSVVDPATTHHVNATGMLNLLWAAREAGVKRFVWASSSSVYGDPEPAGSAKAEDLTPRPLSPYAVSKLAAEYYAQVFYQLYGLETVTLRYFNVFGPHQSPQGEYAAVIPKFIANMMNARPPVIFGDGRQSRDFTYVDNVVEANLLALTAAGAPGRVMNVAAGQTHDLIQLVELLNRLLGTDLAPIFQPARPGDIRHSLADIGQATAILGFTPRATFVDGLAKTVEFFRQAG